MSADIVQAKNEKQLASVTESQGFYTSLALKTRGDKMRMLNTINNSVPLADVVGSEISIVDVVMQTVDVTNLDTGEYDGAVRTTLVCEDGTAYHATSVGIVQSLRQLFNIIGDPTSWGEPVKANVREQKGRKGFRYLTLDFVE